MPSDFEMCTILLRWQTLFWQSKGRDYKLMSVCTDDVHRFGSGLEQGLFVSVRPGRYAVSDPALEVNIEL